MGSDGWSLGIDLGSSSVKAAVGAGGRAHSVLIDGMPQLPGVVATGPRGVVLVGEEALRHATSHPGTAQPALRRAFETSERVLLGDSWVPTGDLVAAVFRRAHRAATRDAGHVSPQRIVLTYPDRWGTDLLDRLRATAGDLGWGEPVVVSEGEAAIWWGVHLGDITPHDLVAVYDMGALETSALVGRLGKSGIEPLGRMSAPWGGVTMADIVVDLILNNLRVRDSAQHAALFNGSPEENLRESRRHRAGLRPYAVAALENLANQPGHVVAGAVIGGRLLPEILLTRGELDACLAQTFQEQVDVLADAMAMAGTPPNKLKAVILSGSATRMPFIRHQVQKYVDTYALGARIRFDPEPGTLVARGAAVSSPG